MPIIAWLPLGEEERPIILGIYDKLTASTGALHHDSYLILEQEFEEKLRIRRF